MNLNLKLKIFPGTLRAPHPAPPLSMTYDRPYVVLLGILHRSLILEKRVFFLMSKFAFLKKRGWFSTRVNYQYRQYTRGWTIEKYTFSSILNFIFKCQ